MGNPALGSKVETTMSLSKGKHLQSVSVGASPQFEKLGKLENPSSSEKLTSGAALSPRITEEQSISVFLGDKKMKRRTRSSQGLELNGVATGLSSVTIGGQRRGGSGNVTPKSSQSPRAKGICTSPGVEKYAVAKIAASLFHSPTKLERSMSMSRVAYRVVPDADGSTPRSRTGVREAILLNQRDILAELEQQDSQRELESRLQAVVAHRSGNGSSRNPYSELLETKVEGDKACGEQTNAEPFSSIGSGCAHVNYEDLQAKAIEVLMVSSNNPSHGLLGSSGDPCPNGEYLCSNAAHLPIKDIHPVCFETTNKLRTEQELTMSLDMGHDLHEIARSCSFSAVDSTQQPYLSRGSNCNGPELAACEPLHLDLQSRNLSNRTLSENSHRINHPNVLPTSNYCPAGIDLSYQDIKEVTLPHTCEAFQTKVLVCNQENEAEKNAHSVAYSSEKVAEAGLREAKIQSTLIYENGSVLLLEESKQVVTDASQSKDAREIHFSPKKEVGLRKINGSEPCLRKSTSFELGEKRTKVRKRRRSVSASGIGAMLLKIVRTSEPATLEARSLPRTESDVYNASSLLVTTSLHQDGQFKTETNKIEAVDMDVEYEDCSSELVTAADIDIVCYDMEDSSNNKDTERPSEEVKLQLVDDTQLRKIENCSEGGQAKLVLHNPQEHDQVAGSGSRSFNDECDKRVISLETTGICHSHSAIKADSDPEERFLDARDKSLDRSNSFESIETSSPTLKGACNGEKITNEELVVTENAKVNCHKGSIEDGFGGSQRRRRHGSRGRLSHDLDSCTVAIEESRRSLSLVDENLCMITNLERSRNFASMLQVSPRQSVDEPTQSRLAPSSIAILNNPSFSSSHQDRLWEEQAEYSSGGRGTPGREDDIAAEDASPSGAISSDDHIRSAAASLRKSHDRDTSAGSSLRSGFASDSGRSHDKRKLGQVGKKRGRPQRSPLRSLLAAEDLHDKPPASQRSPERGRFLRQILSRITGRSSSPRSSLHKSLATTPKRRNGTIWSTCMCFSHVK